MNDFTDIPVSSRLLKAVENLEVKGVNAAAAPVASNSGELTALKQENTQLKQKQAEAKKRLDAMISGLKEGA